MAIYKRGREFELGTTEHKSSKWLEAGHEPGTAGLRVRRADHSAMLPPPEYLQYARNFLHVSILFFSKVCSSLTSLKLIVNYSKYIRHFM